MGGGSLRSVSGTSGKKIHVMTTNVTKGQLQAEVTDNAKRLLTEHELMTVAVDFRRY